MTPSKFLVMNYEFEGNLESGYVIIFEIFYCRRNFLDFRIVYSLILKFHNKFIDLLGLINKQY